MSELQHTTVQMDKSADVTNQTTNLGNHHGTADDINGRLPRAVPEIDDDAHDDRPFAHGHNSGVDDGLLDGENARGSGIGNGNRNGNGDGNGNGNFPRANDGRRPSYAFPGYNGPGVVMYNGVETPIPDVNAYQHKKTLAQGMMDLALLSANGNQLRYVLGTNRESAYFYPSLIFIILSIVFQIAVGVGLIWNGRYNIKDEKEICRANKINNYTVIGIFIVTVVNVLISSFGVVESAPITQS